MNPNMPMELVDVEIDEVSLVPQGANQAAFVCLAKRKPEEQRMDDLNLADIAKANAEMQEQLAKAANEAEELRKENLAKEVRLAALEKQILKDSLEKQVRETKAAVDIAKTVDALLGDATTQRALIFDLLKQLANTQEPLLKTHGSASAQETNVLTTVQTLVAKTMADNPRLNKYQAESLVWKMNPDLQIAYENQLTEGV